MSIVLVKLFGVREKQWSRWRDRVIEPEGALMQALAEVEVDERLDNGALIGSGDEYEE